MDHEATDERATPADAHSGEAGEHAGEPGGEHAGDRTGEPTGGDGAGRADTRADERTGVHADDRAADRNAGREEDRADVRADDQTVDRSADRVEDRAAERAAGREDAHAGVPENDHTAEGSAGPEGDRVAEGATGREDDRAAEPTDEWTAGRTTGRTAEPTAEEDEGSRNDLRITVEPGIPRPVGPHPAGPRTDPAGEAALEESSEDCRHRVRVRDLTTGGRLLYAAGLLAVAAAGAVQLLALFIGGFLLSIGAEISGTVPVVNGALLVLGAMFGMIGVFALVGTWRRLHRPEAPVAWLAIAGTLLTATALLLTGLWVDMPVAALAALPSGAVAAILVYLRAVLAPRETCDDDPALPARALAWLAP
ncbi:hypothetical protein [Glycomyces albidus]|uniref:Uncharacterized protein n=1 Tax=Glycomyces albidus TaxID=2656774 RepID=A0A6L5GE28_9ACTN|nr:hypothetical protein [Glycomyces albidus]MQM27952.1 hypothetical protein [Glycomyces albidus]